MELVKINDVSKMTKLSKATIYGYTCKKIIPHYKLGNELRFEKSEIIEWIKEKYVQSV